MIWTFENKKKTKVNWKKKLLLNENVNILKIKYLIIELYFLLIKKYLEFMKNS